MCLLNTEQLYILYSYGVQYSFYQNNTALYTYMRYKFASGSTPSYPVAGSAVVVLLSGQHVRLICLLAISTYGAALSISSTENMWLQLLSCGTELLLPVPSSNPTNLQELAVLSLIVWLMP